MEDIIKSILFKLTKQRRNNDNVIRELYENGIYNAAAPKNLQFRIGRLWEIFACEHCCYIKVKGIYLVHLEKTNALELKNSAITENSSSREGKKLKLLEFKKNHYHYNLHHLCINSGELVLKENWRNNARYRSKCYIFNIS